MRTALADRFQVRLLHAYPQAAQTNDVRSYTYIYFYLNANVQRVKRDIFYR